MDLTSPIRVFTKSGVMDLILIRVDIGGVIPALPIC